MVSAADADRTIIPDSYANSLPAPLKEFGGISTSSENNATTMEQESPFVSVIIPVFNDVERLAQCLAALEQQSYAADRYEVIVVDNGSRNSIAPHVAPFPHAITEFEPRAGSYAARNRGLESARGDILAFTDADCVPSPQWLQEGIQVLQAPHARLVGGRVEVFARKPGQPGAVELYEMLYAFPQDVNVRAGFSVTANLLAKRLVFDQMGSFDAGLKSGGDRDWVARAVAAGNCLLYSETALVRHPARYSLWQLRQRSARFAGGDFDRAHRGSLSLRRARIETLLKLKPPLSVTRQVLFAPHTGSLKLRLNVLGVAYFANLTYAIEWLRLELGATPRR